MRPADFRLAIAFTAFLALLIVWAWPDGVQFGTLFGVDPMPLQSYE
jgi:hypothetical protein